MCETCDKLERIRDEDLLSYYSMILSEAPGLLRVLQEYLADEDAAKFAYLVNRKITKETHTYIGEWTDWLAHREIGLVLLDAMGEDVLKPFVDGIPVKRLQTVEGCRKELIRGGAECDRLVFNLCRFHQAYSMASHLKEMISQANLGPPKKQEPKLPN